MPVLLAYVAMLAFDFAIIAGTAYVVFWLGFSGWWFLLAALFVNYSAPLSDDDRAKREEAPPS